MNIASAHGLVASAQKVAYVSAKHGIIGLTKTVALETATTGVTCNAICPGWVLTPLVQRQIDAGAAAARVIVDAEKRDQWLGEKQPSQEFVTPEQIAVRCRVPVLRRRRTGARRRLERRRRLVDQQE